MTQTFSLKKGEIIFENDKILISDKAKAQKYMNLVTFGILTLLGIKNSLKATETIENSIDLYWIIFGTLNFLFLVLTLIRSTKNSIELHDVKSIKLKKRFNHYFLRIKLKDNRYRFVGQIEEPEEINEFITKYFYELNTKTPYR